MLFGKLVQKKEKTTFIYEVLIKKTSFSVLVRVLVSKYFCVNVL
jgi:hypothetical protein